MGGIFSYTASGRMRAILILTVLVWYPGRLFPQSDLPDIPDLVKVTVDHSDNGVVIRWEPSSDSSVYRYHLYKMNEDLAFEQLFSFGPSTLEYKHTTSGLKNLAYAVTAEDSAGNESLFADNVHRAVTLSAGFDPCTPSSKLSWTAYEGWEGEVSGYRIYGGIDTSTLAALDFVPSATLQYTHKGIRTDTTYSYYIETVHISGKRSLSAVESVGSHYPQGPARLTVDRVDVLDRTTVEVQFTADISGEVNDFRLMRRALVQPDDTLSPYTAVTTVTDPATGTQVIQDQVPVLQSRYEYVVEALYHPESCLQPLVIAQSNPGTTILLEGSLEDGTARLSWTPYRNYPEGLSGYLIQRKNGSGGFYGIQSVGPGTTAWNEPVESVINGYQPGALHYRILAVGRADETGESAESRSNEVTLHVETHLKVPNAFTPGSNDMNFEFRPLIDFAPETYTMIVYDRSGRKVFETTDPAEGWQGRYQGGEFVQEGVYVYYIQYTDFTGLFRTLTGNVTVLYP